MAGPMYLPRVYWPQSMVYRSPGFRLVLALLMAVWSPLCLCQTHAEAAGRNEPSPANHASSEGHSHHGHEHGGGHDEDAPADRPDDGPGAPCHEHDGPGCDCPELSATGPKPDQSLKLTVAPLVAVVQWLVSPMSVPHQVAFRRDTDAVPRSPTTLLGMHCALIV